MINSRQFQYLVDQSNIRLSKQILVQNTASLLTNECKYQGGICPRWYLLKTSNKRVKTNIRVANEPSSVLNRNE